MKSEQFFRISRLIGNENLEELHKKNILIVGMGAVGGQCLEALARSGVGNFTLVDFDTISVTNINRQILATWDTVGKSKVEEAKNRVLAINPDCNVRALPYFCNEESIEKIFDVKYDLVIDAIDSLNPKCFLLQYCFENKYTVISSMGAALKRNPFLVRSADLFETYGCPLARLVRKRLKSRGISKGIDVIFSPEIIRYEYKDPKDEENYEFNEQILEKGRMRNVLGSLPTVTGIFGLNLAHLALSKLVDQSIFTGEEAFDAKHTIKN